MAACLILGRDCGDSDALTDEEDFCAWVGYVCEHIDAECGFVVDVDTRSPEGIQTDAIRGADDAEEGTIEDAKHSLWDRFCSDDSAWPKRDGHQAGI